MKNILILVLFISTNLFSQSSVRYRGDGDRIVSIVDTTDYLLEYNSSNGSVVFEGIQFRIQPDTEINSVRVEETKYGLNLVLSTIKDGAYADEISDKDKEYFISIIDGKIFFGSTRLFFIELSCDTVDSIKLNRLKYIRNHVEQ